MRKIYFHSASDLNCLKKVQETGVLTEELEEEYFHALDKEFTHGSDETEKIDAMVFNGKLDIKNFFYGDKDPGESGSWIKVRTATGFQLRFARRAKKKIDYWKELRSCQRAMNDPSTSLKKLEEIGERILYLRVLEMFDISPVFVKFPKTKTQETWLTPTEYEIVKDIDEYVDVLMSDKSGFVKLHTIWDERNRDQVFYLQSRGIEKKKAQFLASMERCWFEVDVVGASQAICNRVRVVSKDC